MLMIHVKLRLETHYIVHNNACKRKLSIEASVQLSAEFHYYGATQPRHTNEDACSRKLDTVTNEQVSANF